MKTRILVLDDEDVIGETLTAYLEPKGFQVVAITSAHELFPQLESAAFNLVVLDLALPDSDGLELLESVKHSYPNLPVVILTGMGYDNELMGEAKRLGADGYVSKTVALPQLHSEIRRILRGPADTVSA